MGWNHQLENQGKSVVFFVPFGWRCENLYLEKMGSEEFLEHHLELKDVSFSKFQVLQLLLVSTSLAAKVVESEVKIASGSGNWERWLDRLGTCIFTCLVLSGYHWLTKPRVPEKDLQDGVHFPDLWVTGGDAGSSGRRDLGRVILFRPCLRRPHARRRLWHIWGKHERIYGSKPRFFIASHTIKASEGFPDGKA